MHRLRIVHTLQADKAAAAVKLIEQAFSEYQDLEVITKSSQDASISDFQVADILVIGQLEENGTCAEPAGNFKEIIRALGGINLAGRLAGFFCDKKDSVPLLFEEALKDTDIRYFQDTLVLQQGKNDKSTIVQWATRLYNDFKNHLS